MPNLFWKLLTSPGEEASGNIIKNAVRGYFKKERPADEEPKKSSWFWPGNNNEHEEPKSSWPFSGSSSGKKPWFR